MVRGCLGRRDSGLTTLQDEMITCTPSFSISNKNFFLGADFVDFARHSVRSTDWPTNRAEDIATHDPHPGPGGHAIGHLYGSRNRVEM